MIITTGMIIVAGVNIFAGVLVRASVMVRASAMVHAHLFSIAEACLALLRLNLWLGAEQCLQKHQCNVKTIVTILRCSPPRSTGFSLRSQAIFGPIPALFSAEDRMAVYLHVMCP